MANHSGLNSPALIRFMCNESDAGWATQPIVLIGEGPWSSAEMHSFLAVMGVSHCTMDGACQEKSPVVIGETGWEPGKLVSYIKSRNLANFDIYTQDLFMAGAIFGDESVGADEALPSIAATHPGIQLLLANDLLKWRLPETVAKNEVRHAQRMDEALRKVKLQGAARSVAIEKNRAAKRGVPYVPETRHTPNAELATLIGPDPGFVSELWYRVIEYYETIDPNWEQSDSFTPDEALIKIVGTGVRDFENFEGTARAYIKKLPETSAASTAAYLDLLEKVHRETEDRTRAAEQERRAQHEEAPFFTPSPELAAITGVKPQKMAEIIKKVYDYSYKMRDKASRTIVPDTALAKVFGKAPFDQTEFGPRLRKHLTQVV